MTAKGIAHAAAQAAKSHVAIKAGCLRFDRYIDLSIRPRHLPATVCVTSLS